MKKNTHFKNLYDLLPVSTWTRLVEASERMEPDDRFQATVKCKYVFEAMNFLTALAGSVQGEESGNAIKRLIRHNKAKNPDFPNSFNMLIEVVRILREAGMEVTVNDDCMITFALDAEHTQRLAARYARRRAGEITKVSTFTAELNEKENASIQNLLAMELQATNVPGPQMAERIHTVMRGFILPTVLRSRRIIPYNSISDPDDPIDVSPVVVPDASWQHYRGVMSDLAAKWLPKAGQTKDVLFEEITDLSAEQPSTDEQKELASKIVGEIKSYVQQVVDASLRQKRFAMGISPGRQ